MTNEELLLIDLLGRLSHNVKIRLGDYDYEVCGYNSEKEMPVKIWYYYDSNSTLKSYVDVYLADYCPYLRPLSSMTEDEAKELSILCGIKDILSIKITDEYIDFIVDDGVCSSVTMTIWYDEIISSIEIFNWCNKNHFDYCRLIPKGLAIEAPNGMYNKNN